MTFHTIDLNFLNRKGGIAAYVSAVSNEALIIDPGPETTLPNLQKSLKSLGIPIEKVKHILLTHIHLDHAGAAGWFAEKGARIYIHPLGSPHMLNPEKLVASATRLYGDWMEKLWGEMKPVPDDRLVRVDDDSEINIGNSDIHVVYTPGHSEHHMTFVCEDTLFSGDIGGVRYKPSNYVRLPFVPPETNLEKWRTSLKRMKEFNCQKIAPTHFGVFNLAGDHISSAERFLDDIEGWLVKVMPDIQDIETLTSKYAAYLRGHGEKEGLDSLSLASYDEGNPISFAASGLFRYWQKVRKSM